MILIDANLLIYAYVRDMSQHGMAKAWLDGQLNERPRVGLPWPSLLTFVCLTANPRIFEHPVSVMTAWHQVERWLAHPSVWVPTPTAKHRETLGLLLGSVQGGANLVPDAHLAALAIQHGLILCSADGDFARFPNLRWENPLMRSP